jgi:transposase
VERLFRDAKTLLKTRPIFHKRDETIRGHVFHWHPTGDKTKA